MGLFGSSDSSASDGADETRANQPSKDNPRYVAQGTTPGRAKHLKRAATHQVLDEEEIVGHVVNEASSGMRAIHRRQIAPEGRKFRRQAWRAAAKQHHLHDATVTDRKRLAVSRALEIHYRELVADLAPSSAVSATRSNRIKIAMKTLVVAGEMTVIGSAFQDLLQISRGLAWLSSIGLSLALLALPALFSKHARAVQASKLLRPGDGDSGIRRIYLEHAHKNKPPANQKAWQLYAAYGVVLIALSGCLGLLVSLTPDVNNPEVKGLAITVVLVATGIGVAAIEYRLTTLEGEVVKNLEQRLAAEKRRANGLDRRPWSALRRIGKSEGRLRMFDTAVGVDVEGRWNSAVSEALAAGGDIKDASDVEPFADAEELTPFIPMEWRAAPRPMQGELDLDKAITADLEERLRQRREHLLEIVDVSGRPLAVGDSSDEPLVDLREHSNNNSAPSHS